MWKPPQGIRQSLSGWGCLNPPCHTVPRSGAGATPGTSVGPPLRPRPLGHRIAGCPGTARRPGAGRPVKANGRKAVRMVEVMKLAIVGGTLIDGTGKDPVRDAVVLVDGKTVKGVGRKGQLGIPNGCRVVDATGKTVTPGLIDSHLHISSTTMSVEKRLFTHKTVELFRTAEMMKRTLHSGITTIRDAGTLADVGLRQAVEMGLVEGPRLIVSGGIGQTGGHFDQYYPHDLSVPFHDIPICDGVPAVQEATRRLLRTGVDFIKVCTTGGVLSP